MAWLVYVILGLLIATIAVVLISAFYDSNRVSSHSRRAKEYRMIKIDDSSDKTLGESFKEAHDKGFNPKKG